MITNIPLTVWKDGAGEHFTPAEGGSTKIYRKYIPSDTIAEIVATDYGSRVTVSKGGVRQDYEVLETPDQIKAAEDPSASNVHAAHELNLGLDAAGSAQGAGVAANRYYNTIDAATDTSAEAVDIPVMAVNEVKVIVNLTAVALELFPASGDNFRGKSANAVLDMAANSVLILYCIEADVVDYIVVS